MYVRLKQKQQDSHYFFSFKPQLQPSYSKTRHLSARAVTSNHRVTFELMSLALDIPIWLAWY